MGWLEPIQYREDDRGWWASARHVTVCAPTKDKARSKLYRAMNRRYAERAKVGVDRVLAALDGGQE